MSINFLSFKAHSFTHLFIRSSDDFRYAFCFWELSLLVIILLENSHKPTILHPLVSTLDSQQCCHPMNNNSNNSIWEKILNFRILSTNSTNLISIQRCWFRAQNSSTWLDVNATICSLLSLRHSFNSCRLREGSPLLFLHNRIFKFSKFQSGKKSGSSAHQKTAKKLYFISDCDCESCWMNKWRWDRISMTFWIAKGYPEHNVWHETEGSKKQLEKN